MFQPDETLDEKYLIQIQDYEFQECINRGGYGLISKVKEKKTGKEFVAKCNFSSDDYHVKCITREINTLIHIQHQTIVRFHGFSYQDFNGRNNITFILDYYKNGSLSSLLSREFKEKKLPANFDNTQRQIIMVGIAFGVMILHRRNVIYRDLKPGNVLLDDDLKPILTDFGLSKIFDPENSTEQSIDVASEPYMAPEFFIKEFDIKVDVYAFAITMYEIVMHHPSYQTFKKILEKKRPKFTTKIKEGLEKLIKECWDEDPDKRPQFSEIFCRLSHTEEVEEGVFKPIQDENFDTILDDVDMDKLYSYVDEITKNKSQNDDCQTNEQQLKPDDSLNEICISNEIGLDVTNEVDKNSPNSSQINKKVAEAILSKTKEIFKLILSLKYDIKASSNLPKFIRNLTLLFPKNSEISLILKDLEGKFFDISKFNFPILPSNLEEILKLFVWNIDSDEIIKIISLYTFYTWMSMVIYIINHQKIDYSAMLMILNHISKIAQNDTAKQQYYAISISCFYHINFFYLELFNEEIENFEDCLNEICKFFVFNQKLPKNSDFIIEILAKKILTSEYENNHMKLTFISVIALILNKNPSSLSQKTILLIIELKAASIIQLDLISLKLFSSAVNYISLNAFIGCFEPILYHILAIIKEDEQLEEKIEMHNEKLFVYEFSDHLHSPSDLYQIDKIDKSIKIPVIEVKELISFINAQISSIIYIIENMLICNENNSKYFLNFSIKDLEKTIHNIKLIDNKDDDNLVSIQYFYKKCAFIFHLVSVISKQYPNIQIKDFDINVLIKDIVYLFDPNITYFTQNADFPIISSLRDFIIKFLLKKDHSSLNKFLQNISIYPELFQEIIYRLSSIIKTNNQYLLISNTLITYLFNYRIDFNFDYHEEHNHFILTIRKTLLSIIDSFLSNDFILNFAFCSEKFMQYFINLLLERPIRNLFTFKLKNILVSPSAEKSVINDLCQYMNQFLDFSFKELPKTELLSLISDILITFSWALINNKCLIDMLKPVYIFICTKITDNHKMFFNEEFSIETENCMVLLINFLANVLINKTINKNDISLFESIAAHLKKTNLQDHIIKKYFQIIASENSILIQKFEIKKPKIICNFIQLFLDTNKIYKIIKFISDLCSYSYNNCIKCHEAKLDIFIIDVIKKWRTKITKVMKQETEDNSSSEEEDYFLNDDETFIIENDHEFIVNEKLINLLLHLFVQISSVVSTYTIFQRYISLLNLNEMTNLPLIHEHILKALKEILVPFPFTKLPMLPSNEIKISNIPPNSLGNGFSFCFWISLPLINDNYTHNIISLFDNKSFLFEVVINNNDIYVQIKHDNNSFTSKIQLNTSIRTWTMITISLETNNNVSDITFYVNNKQINKSTNQKLLIQNNSVSCVINQSKFIKDKKMIPPFMGLFILSKPLNIDDINRLAEDWQTTRVLSILPKIIFAYAPKFSGNYLSIHTIKKIPDIQESYQQILPFLSELSITDIVIKYINADVFIPIFLVLNYKNVSNMEDLLTITLSILKNLFYLGKDIQHSFYSSNGFFAISYLLRNADDSYITYDLYMKFYDLFGFISYKNLRLQLIDAIIMDFEIWKKSNSTNQLNIYRHWNQVFLNSYDYMVCMVRSFGWILYIIHYYFQANESSENSSRFLHSSCRYPLYEIATQILKFSFDESHLDKVFAIIVSDETSLNEKIKMFDIIKFVICDKEIITKYKNIELKIINFMFHILGEPAKNDVIINQIIYFFINSKMENNFMQQLFVAIIQRIINLFLKQKYIFDKDFFRSLIIITNKNKIVELFPLLCMNVILGGEEYLNMMIEELNQNQDYTSIQSTIYFVYLLFSLYSKESLYDKTIKFFVNIYINIQNYDEVFNAINIVGYSCFEPDIFDNIKHDILIMMIKKPKNIQRLVQISRDFIFFRPKRSQSSILNHLVKENQISNENSDEINTDNRINCNINEVLLNLNKFFFDFKNTEISNICKFGLRFSNDSDDWLDLDLAKDVFDLLIKSDDINDMNNINDINDNEYKQFFFILAHFIKIKESSFRCPINESILLKFHLNSNYEQMVTKHDQTIINDAFHSADNFINSNITNIKQTFVINEDLNNFINEIKKNLLTQSEKNEKIWLKNWQHLTVNRSFWSNPNCIEKQIFKRDEIYCNDYCPYKVVKESSNINDSNKQDQNNDLQINRSLSIHGKIKTITEEINILFSFNEKAIYIKNVSDNTITMIPNKNINNCLCGYQDQKISGIQIFTKNRENYFVIVDLLSYKYLSRVISLFLFNFTNTNNQSIITKQWLEGKISNFSYIMKLNYLSGRCFDDATQYPIFPWILTDYESETLDFSSSSIFRDLSKPIGALNEQRFEELISENFKSESYLYESCYSNIFSVYYYLSRLRPFSIKRKELDESELSYSSSTFDSIHESFIDATTKKDDFRELIPEFFYFPEFLKKQYDSLETNNDATNDNVELPPWANNSPYEFIYLHRVALESDFVSSNLNEWIDLIWGYKQSGKEAIEAKNIFRPDLYESIRKKKSNNDEIKAINENQIKFGQIPNKLFDKKHPNKQLNYPKSSINIFNLPLENSENSDINNKVHHSIIKLNEISSYISVDVDLSSKKDKLVFTILDNKGIIYVYNVLFTLFKSQSFTINKNSSLPIKNNNQNKVEAENIKLSKFINSQHLCFVEDNCVELKIVNCQTGLIEKNIVYKIEIETVETNNDGWIAISTKDTSVSVHDINNIQDQNVKPETNEINVNENELISEYTENTNSSLASSETIQFLGEVVKCISINPIYDSMICGTKDGWIHFCSLNPKKLKVERMIEIKEKPRNIIITDTFGFVVVHSVVNDLTEKLLLFSINGELIRSVKLGNKIVTMTKAMSFNGYFDFLIVADDSNYIYVFEAFYLKLCDPIFKCKSKITKLFYIQEEYLIIALCEDGTVSVVYYPIQKEI